MGEYGTFDREYGLRRTAEWTRTQSRAEQAARVLLDTLDEDMII